MSLESTIYAALSSLVSTRVYPDQAPHGVALPYVTYQRVGGKTINPINGDDPGHMAARVQINAWATTRLGASSLIYNCVAALRPAPVHGRPIGGVMDRSDDVTRHYGSQVDVEIWHDT